MLYWFSHRLSSDNPAVRAANLARAKARLAYLRPSFAARGIVLWAPWIEMAEAGVQEADVWETIEDLIITRCKGIALDCSDGEPSDGMIRERAISGAVGAKVEVVR